MVLKLEISTDPACKTRHLKSFFPTCLWTTSVKLAAGYLAASFKMFWWTKWKSKSLTNSRDFYPNPPNKEKLKSSVFWMN